MVQHFTKISDWSPTDLQSVLRLSQALQDNSTKAQSVLSGKNVLFCFEKPSLRTAVGTEAAINNLGGKVIHIDAQTFLGSNAANAPSKSSERESLADTVNTVQQYCDAIFTRVFSHETIKALTNISQIPVVNALCDQHHPMQALTDLLTIQQNHEGPARIAFVGDANNVAFSLFQLALTLGHSVSWAGPKQYEFSDEQKGNLQALANKNDGKLILTNDPVAAVSSADFVYADTFVSMGEEDKSTSKLEAFASFQVNKDLWKHCPNAKFLHCLPAHRGVEVTSDIIDGPNSLVYLQAKNRMVTAKGVFAWLLHEDPKSLLRSLE